MMSSTDAFLVPPDQLTSARQLSHAAVQWPSRAARANIAAAADDSHSNLGWNEDNQALISHHLDKEQRYQMGYSFADSSLIWLEDGAVTESMTLGHAAPPAAKFWCNERLAAVGLNATDQAEMPYEPPRADYRFFIGPMARDQMQTLGSWYSQAQAALEQLRSEFSGVAVSPVNVRCWPHHFDLALLLALEEGNPETAQSIGVGFSPGDGSIAEPYYYCTPWPAPNNLLPSPSPMSWHTEGFTALVCPASNIDQQIDVGALLISATRIAQQTLTEP